MWFSGKGPTFLIFMSFSLSDAISSANPRVIDDSRARKLSNDLKRCTYYETCATYGLNVERVFQDGKSSCVWSLLWEGDIPPTAATATPARAIRTLLITHQLR